MSQENVDLARRSILAWNERGVEALIENLDPERIGHPRERRSGCPPAGSRWSPM
jgi:hypothetical protein